MNTETGEIYRDQLALEAAIARGETVVPVSEKVATAMEMGIEALNREMRRAQRFPRNERRTRTGSIR